MPVCIVGMHRSGTSLVAGALRACGLYLGKDADLMPAREDNPAGFWENTRFVDLNDQILSALGGAWDCPPGSATGWDGAAGVEQLRPQAEALLSEFEGVELWGWKDPRNSLTVPFWSALVEPLQFVVCLRGPLDVAVSLARRNNLSVRLGIKLWTGYMERILATVPPDRRTVTHAARFFSEPRPELERLLDFLAMAPSKVEIDQALASISPQLWTGPADELEMEQAGVPAHALRLYHELCAEADAAAPTSAPPRERQLERRATAVVSGNGASNGSPGQTDGVGGAHTVQGGQGPGGSFAGHINADELTTMRRERRELQRVTVELAIKHGALERELEMLRELPADKAELERRLGALQADHEQIKRSAEELRAEARRQRPIERRLGELLAAQRRLQGEVTQLRRSAAEGEDLKERLRCAEEQVSSLERDLAQQRDQSSSDRRQTRERIAALRVELAQARQQNGAMAADARAARGQLSRTRKQLARVEQQVTKLQDKLGRARGELASTREELASTREELLQSHEQLLLRDRTQLDALAPAPAGARHETSVDPSDYLRMIERLREQVRLVVPPHAHVLVVSRGDERLLELDARPAWHFPRDPSGKYAGHYPANGVEATQQLEALRAAGGEFLVIPSTSLWWLDYYTEFAEHLSTRCAEQFRDPDTGVIFALTTSVVEAATEVPAASTVGGEPTRRLLAQRSAQVHSLLDRCSRLTRELEEAHQRAAADSRDALLRARLKSFLPSGRQLVFPHQQTPDVSVVIPSYNQAHLLYQALESLKATSGETPFEVVIVDNASGEESRELFSRLGNVRVHLNERNTGFGAACGLGAEIARAPYVCFLNSDTIVTPGWLDALVQTARSYPSCGAVGAKLVHADGRLQEAGSMIWNDGSAWAYGRGGDPSAPQYCYPREVDYCSAACLLVSRSLFMRLGGFDERYAPAYYEDSDLCMAIAEAGFKTVYEPRAVVFHLEFGSSDGQDSIALQLRNREKFVEKWETPLREHLAPAQENVLAARDSRRSRRVLVVDDRIPDCGQGSGFPRAVALLESLVALGYAVTLMPVRDRRPLEPALSHLQGLGVEVLHSVDDVQATLVERAPVCDVAIVSRPHNLPLANVIREASQRTALIYDAEAVVAARDVLEAEVEGRYVPAAEREAMITAELDAIGSADLVLTVSGPEQRMMQEHGESRVEVWGDCLPVEKPQRRYRERHDLLFVGSLATPPNADAVSHLLNRILPAVRKRLSARLLIVGANPEPRLWSAPIEATDGVLFTGFVADLAPVYESARVFLAPHRFAAGVPHKVIEAMAHGVPCVVSRLLGDQLELEDGQGVLIADSTEDFAEKVSRLYGDRRFWADQQRRAMQVISERYDPSSMREMLHGFVETAVDAVAVGSVATRDG